MSTDEEDVAKIVTSPSTSATSSRAARNASNLLRHQQSFEARYSSIIQKQIWETTINKDVMQQQINEYFPFARSASLSRNENGSVYHLLSPTTGNGEGSLRARSLGTTPNKQRSEESLEKSDSLKKAGKAKDDP